MRRKPEKRPVVFRIKKTGQKEKMTPSFPSARFFAALGKTDAAKES